MKVVADGDTLAYKAAFSTQYQTYHIEDEEMTFRYLKDCVDWLSLNFDADERPDFQKVQVLEPLSHSLHIVNLMIEEIKNNTQATVFTIYLSGENNFRKKIPYPVEYKGGRPEKPVRLPDIRKHLIERHGAIVTDGYEADDAIGIFAYANPGCVIASVDKDLRMLEGLHYHLDRKDFTSVNWLEATQFFYRQMLIGDRVDNVIGIPKVGEKTAEKFIDKLLQESDMDRVVREQYKKAYPDKWYQMYRSTYDLLRILRSQEEYEKLKEVYGKDSTVKEGEGTTITAVGER